MATLFESYKNRLALSEKMHMQAHNGAKMSDNKKLVVAKCLENINRCLNEAFESSVGTQRSDLGAYKKFALNLVTVALPNLIAHDLVIVHPMSSYSGYINYVEYLAGQDKGEIKREDLFNSPFGLGKVDPNYTGSRVVEEIAAEATKFEPAWTPVVGDVEGRVKATGEWEKIADLGTFDAGKYDKARYIYDNEVIPQEKLPTVKAVMKTMPLVAKARRIAIYFSQFAAFQAKTDYGFDLGDQLAEKAVGQLSYKNFVA